VIIDYKTGNLGSILNMFKKIGVEATVSSNVLDIERADKIILSGVGSFDSGIDNLKDAGLIPVLNEMVLVKKIPILGICLGMQLFSKKSEEGKLAGFNWINAETVRFKFDDRETNLKVPHMGWDTINTKRESPLLANMYQEARFYFVHSYHLICENQEDVIATTNHGYEFPSIVQKENIFGVQFHPEKSHKFGIKLFENFVNLC